MASLIMAAALLATTSPAGAQGAGKISVTIWYMDAIQNMKEALKAQAKRIANFVNVNPSPDGNDAPPDLQGLWDDDSANMAYIVQGRTLKLSLRSGRPKDLPGNDRNRNARDAIDAVLYDLVSETPPGSQRVKVLCKAAEVLGAGEKNSTASLGKCPRAAAAGN